MPFRRIVGGRYSEAGEGDMIKELRDSDPSMIGPYRLLGRLGAGGMGQVFVGQSPGGRLVAVKVIRPELADERGFHVRFGREVAAARNVSGMFTAPVVDADAEAEEPWLATAYVPGPSLAEAVEEHGALPVSTVLALAAGLAEGLGAIHAAGVVHRDLKPGNVLLADDGPRVIDFGISRATETSMLTQSDLAGFARSLEDFAWSRSHLGDLLGATRLLGYSATPRHSGRYAGSTTAPTIAWSMTRP
jgi:serine/threonine protein kinase